MSLRIAWACYDRNVSLGIAATIFVYVGTIILYIVNWFFTQRIVRAQHPTWGWSQPFRVFHRAALGSLIACLFILIVAAIQQFFTLDQSKLRIYRILQLTGQTYFSSFAFAPLVVIFISLIIPRKRSEKFGAGRLRNNITILLIATSIISLGQIFRCVILWFPPVSVRGPRGPQSIPWYFSRACFYVFNFTTELLVIIFYAVVRVDLRFHVQDGSKGPGDYSKGRRDSKFHVNVIGDEKNLKRSSNQALAGIHQGNGSHETLHEYEASIFDDSRTLADSLRYPSSVLEVDPKSGHWKIKRVSSLYSDRWSHGSDPSLWSPDRDTYVDDSAPPVPQLPDWPLRESQMPTNPTQVMEHQNRSSRGHSSQNSTEIPDHQMNRVDLSNAIADAMTRLEANSMTNKRARNDGPPDYDAVSTRNQQSSDIPYKKAYFPSSDRPRKHLYSPNSPTASSSSLPKKRYYVPPSPELPKKHDYASDIHTPEAQQKSNPGTISQTTETTKPPSVNRNSLHVRTSLHSRPPLTRDNSSRTHRRLSQPSTTSRYSVDTNEEAAREFARFSFEAPQTKDEESGGEEREKDPST